jgi:hypothetical protein
VRDGTSSKEIHRRVRDAQARERCTGATGQTERANNRPEDSLNCGEKARRVAYEIGKDKLESRSVVFCEHIERLAVAL